MQQISLWMPVLLYSQASPVVGLAHWPALALWLPPYGVRQSRPRLTATPPTCETAPLRPNSSTHRLREARRARCRFQCATALLPIVPSRKWPHGPRLAATALPPILGIQE